MAAILIAEDDPEMRRLLGATLRMPGHEIVLLDDGMSLREYLEARGASEPPALIVSDIQMPGWTGFNVLQYARSRIPATPVVLITAFGDPQTHSRAHELGAAAVFDKPFDMLELKRLATQLVLEGKGE